MSTSSIRTINGFLAATVLVVVGGGLIYMNAVRLEELTSIVSRTQDALLVSENVRRDVLAAESATRGLALTLDMSFADQFETTVEAIRIDLARLKDATETDPGQLVSCHI